MMNEEGRQFLGKLGVDSIDSLSQEQVSDIMEKYDVNGDGHIDRAEFIAFLRDLFVLVGQECLADDELDLLYQDADSDGSGFVDKAEFLKMFAAAAPVSQPTEEGIQFLAKLGVEQMECLTHSQMTAIMDRYDVNRDGRIDKKEFVNFLRDLFKLVGQDAPSDEELGLLYDDVDNDGSGYVDRDEFLKMFGGDQFDEADE